MDQNFVPANGLSFGGQRRFFTSLRSLCLLGLILLAGGTPAKAAEENDPPWEVTAQAGWIDVFDDGHSNGFVSLEGRLPVSWSGIRPWAGVFVVESEETWFAGGGFLYTFDLPRRFNITVGWGAFYYERGGNAHSLGYSLQFYSFFESSYEFDNGINLGVRIGHFSNGGFSKVNPGTETLALVLSVPIR